MGKVTIDGKEYTLHEAHQDLWKWLSEHPGMFKKDYFRTHFVNPLPARNCFACEMAEDEHESIACYMCPIAKWNASGTCGCCKTNSLYQKWMDCFEAKDYGEACKIAKQIADLEWKEVEE